jgi:N-acetylmuramoyl-L-alanine amidase
MLNKNNILQALRGFAKLCAAVGLLLGAAQQAEAPQAHAAELPEEHLPEIITGETPPEALPFSADELDILYRLAWAEARGEDDKGLILVVNVVMNRVKSRGFPNTIRDVVFQPRQFSPVGNGAFERAAPCDRIKNAVHRALRGEDFSQGALYFRGVRGAECSWHETALTALFDHGGHRFYK